MTEPTFWHYTCAHGRQGIGTLGVLRSPGVLKPEARRPGLSEDERLMLALIWVTDLPVPDIEGLGLTKQILSCERWTHRYRITNHRPIMPFADMQYRFSLDAQMDLLTGDAKPEHWFVSWKPLPAVYDPLMVG